MNQNSIILNRLIKNLKKRKSLTKNNVNAYRLYGKDIPEIPFIIDIYSNNAVIYEKGIRLDKENFEQQSKRLKNIEDIKSSIKKILNINEDNIFFKERIVQKGKNQYTPESKSNEFITVNENNLKFLVNLKDYLDTGLFLDHRPLRQIISKTKDKKTALNLFSYTGSLSVAAAFAGLKVTTVDMSKTYIDWAKENFKLNELDTSSHTFIQQDVLSYLEGDFGSFDIIILDPPSFSNSKRMTKSFNIQDDHTYLIKKLAKNLKEDGTLYFSNNYRDFKLNNEIYNAFDVQDITKASIPSDFRDPKIHHCFVIRNK